MVRIALKVNMKHYRYHHLIKNCQINVIAYRSQGNPLHCTGRNSHHINSRLLVASWYFVYRTDDYKELSGKIDGGLQKYNKQKEQFVKSTQQRTHDKKVTQMESQLKALNQELTVMKMKSNLAIGLLAIITLTSLGSHYQGVPVAKLPFVPFGLLQNVTHRGLFGTDYTDCSYIVIYIITAFIWRANVQRIFGIFFVKLYKLGFEGPKLPFAYPGYAGGNQSLFNK